MRLLKFFPPSLCAFALFLAASAGEARAAPQSGDVYREHHWRPEGKWQRVTGPEAEDERAKRFLPNAVNRIEIADLQGAVKAEVVLEMLLCHGGTIGKQIRVNGGRWIPIPESPLIPGEAGQGPPDTEYQSMRYPVVPIPLDALAEGGNTFELTCRGGSALGGWWPQWILYGATFRIYYRGDKPHATGRIVSPASGAAIGENATFEVAVEEGATIERVDLLGCYEDFNWEGDGDYRQWHYRTLYGKLQSHIGSATEAPYRVRWENAWVPDQSEPIQAMARIVDRSGLCCLTPVVEGLRLDRPYRVALCKPYAVPRRWSTRAGATDECKVDVPTLAGAVAARITVCTWNGVAAREIGINGRKIIENLGKNHDLGYDSFPVPLGLIREGTNTLYTFSDTEEHGIEVQWPGMVLLIRYGIR